MEDYIVEDWLRESLQRTEEGRTFLDYNEKTGGEPLGLIVPIGYPDGVEEMGGVTAVYKACIEKGVRWEELLNYNPPEDADI